MATRTPAIEVHGLSKTFGHQVALREVNLEVAAGQFLALLGPNGAGKTTLIRILASLTRPTAGSVRVLGCDLGQEATAVRRQIGLISHHPLLYGDLTADENLRFFARMYDLPEAQVRITSLLEQVGLAARRHDPVRTFSRGMVQRLSLARALLHDPAVLLLDEPYTGLDLQAADMLRATLHNLAASGRTVILATHNLEQGLEVCHRVAVLHKGRITWQGERAGLDVQGLREAYWQATGIGKE